MKYENEPLRVVRFRNKDAGFYWRRLVYSIQLKNAIDQGTYGQTRYYSASESTLKGDPGDSAVNIYPSNWDRGLGLRHGVLFAIYGSYHWLVVHGYEEECKTLIDHDRYPNGLL